MSSDGELLLLIVVIVCVAVALRSGRWRPSRTAMGSARWANTNDLCRAGLLSGSGLLLGRTADGQVIRIPRYTHIAVFAPTGAGKGVSQIVPWLKTFDRGSVVVLDPKGENAQITAAARRAMGQRVVILDPFKVVTDTPDTFNPLALIGDNDEAVDDARAMAEAMVTRTGEEKDPYWNDQGANVLTGLIAFVASQLRDEERNLSSVRELLTNAEACDGAITLLREMGGAYARVAGVIAQLQDKEKAGVFSTSNRHTTFLDSGAITPSVSANSFDPRDILTGNVALYLVLPAHQWEAQARWLRLVIASLIRLVGREGMQDGKEILFILDEAGSLGHMPPIEQALTLLRYRGVRLAFFFQSMGQLKETFKGKESVLLDNCPEQLFFAVNTPETAKHVSERLGSETIVVESANSGTSHSGEHGHGGRNTTWNSGRNQSVQARELLKIDEVIQLPGSVLIAFLRGCRPIICRRIFWYREPKLGGKSQRPPVPVLWWLLLVSVLGVIAWAVLGLS